MLCSLVIILVSGSGEIRAQEDLSVGQDVTALAQRMDAFVDDPEQVLVGLESVSEGLERATTPDVIIVI